jgi:RNA polymerase sigma factor for flagellar operon FliA
MTPQYKTSAAIAGIRPVAEARPISARHLPARHMSAGSREQLILAHLPRVLHIARGFRRRLPESVSLDDLVSTGVIGLIAAIDRFDEARNLKLTTYAEYKIRGAILDSLRALDWAPRQSRKRSKQIKKAVATLEQRLSRSPDEEEIAQELGLTIHEYHGWLVALTGLEMESLETVKESAPTCEDDSDLRVLLQAAIAKLPVLERRIVRLHCYEELPSREIARQMGLSESRISQLKSQAIGRLRSQAVN